MTGEVRLLSSGAGCPTRLGRGIRVAVGCGAVALLAAACSSSPSTPSAAKKTTTTKATTATTAATVDVVKIGTATVNGKPEAVLTDTAGLTLYYRKSDTPTTATCTASLTLPNGKPCTTVWPPLLLASGTPGSSGTLSGSLTAVSDANGRQVQYNGHFLYTFASDTAPGQANGEGLQGEWYVATPSLAASSAYGSSSGAYGSTSSGAYGSTGSAGSTGSSGSTTTKSSGSSSSGGY